MEFNDLSLFIDKAIKNRKYPENTGNSLKAAIKLFQKELNEEELASIKTFENNLEQIYRTVCSKNGQTLSADSLAAYKSRVNKVLNDYSKYGSDPTAMAQWSPKLKTSIAKNRPEKSKPGSENTDNHNYSQANPTQLVHKIALALRPDSRFVLEVPKDMTSNEASMIKGIIDSLVDGNKDYAKPEQY